MVVQAAQELIKEDILLFIAISRKKKVLRQNKNMVVFIFQEIKEVLFEELRLFRTVFLRCILTLVWLPCQNLMGGVLQAIKKLQAQTIIKKPKVRGKVDGDFRINGAA